MLWWHKDSRNSARSPVVQGGNVVSGVRGWRGARSAWQIAFIESDICLADETGVAAEGISLAPGAATWVATPAMFPSDLTQGSSLFRATLRFTDAGGNALRLTGAIFPSAILDESAASEHVYTTRLYARLGDVYAGQPWQVVPSSYATLMQVIAAGRGAGQQCGYYTFSGLVTRSALESQLCAVHWAELHAVRNLGNPGPPYRAVPTIYAAETSTGPLRISIVPIRGEWLVDRVQP